MGIKWVHIEKLLEHCPFYCNHYESVKLMKIWLTEDLYLWKDNSQYKAVYAVYYKIRVPKILQDRETRVGFMGGIRSLNIQRRSV